MELAEKGAYAMSGILFPKNVAPGTYTITITGVSGSLTNTATEKFTVRWWLGHLDVLLARLLLNEEELQMPACKFVGRLLAAMLTKVLWKRLQCL